MGNDWVNRTTKQHISGASPGAMAERFGGVFTDADGNAASNAEWIGNADLTAVSGHPPKHWTITGDVISLLPNDEGQRDVIDAAEAQAALESDRAQQKARMDQEKALKALALVILDEFNALRVNAGLPERTAAQLLAAHDAKVDTLT